MLPYDESDAEHIYTDILEDIRDGFQSHPNINSREAHYKVRDSFKKKWDVKERYYQDEI